MADKGFNGSTVSIGGTDVSNLRSISWSNPAAAVDVSSLSTTTKAYVNGQRDPSCTIRVCGQPATNFAVGVTGVLLVKFFDNTSLIATTNVIINSQETSGDIDGSIETSLVCKPYVAA